MKEIKLKFANDPGSDAVDLTAGLSLEIAPYGSGEPEPTGDLTAKGILALPEHPLEKPTPTDVGVAVHFDKAYRYRFGTPGDPGQAPAAGTGGRATLNVWDLGARPGKDSSSAFQRAVSEVKDGGKVFVPYGAFPAANVQVPGGKDLIIEGESELGSQIVGFPGKDIFVFDDLNVQRRLQNVPIFRNLMFCMSGNGSKGPFSRSTISGWGVGAAAIAFVQNSQTPDGNRKQAWGNSYIVLENVRARADKDAVGATLLWSERALYGMRAYKIFIGDHGTTVSGTQGGIIMGKPRYQVAEYAPDEFGVFSFVHWGGVCSIHVPNIANGQIMDHKAYACRQPLHLPALANVGARRRGRDLELNGLYYDNDVVVTTAADPAMILIDADGVEFGIIHIKGSRGGSARPTIQLSGEDIVGGQFRIMSSSAHRAPQFKISGNGHEFKVRAGGVDAGEKATMFNGKASYRRVTVK